jgi:hypothetical protein
MLKKISKRGSVSFNLRNLVTFTLSIIVLIILIAFSTKFLSTGKKADLAGCKMQIASSIKDTRTAFTSCHSYKVVFGKDSAKKYALADDSGSYIFEYKYKDVLKKLVNIYPPYDSLKLKSNQPIPEEIIYYLIAEEMKECHDIYHNPQMRSNTFFDSIFAKNSFVCQPCSMIEFNDDFPDKHNDYDHLNKFLMITPHTLDSPYPYYQYFSMKSPCLEKDYKVGDYVFPAKYDLSFSTDELYQVMFLYEPDVAYSKLYNPKNLVAGNSFYIHSIFVNLIPLNEMGSACTFYLPLMPKEDTVGLSFPTKIELDYPMVDCKY